MTNCSKCGRKFDSTDGDCLCDQGKSYEVKVEGKSNLSLVLPCACQKSEDRERLAQFAAAALTGIMANPNLNTTAKTTVVAVEIMDVAEALLAEFRRRHP